MTAAVSLAGLDPLLKLDTQNAGPVTLKTGTPAASTTSLVSSLTVKSFLEMTRVVCSRRTRPRTASHGGETGARSGSGSGGGEAPLNMGMAKLKNHSRGSRVYISTRR